MTPREQAIANAMEALGLESPVKATYHCNWCGTIFDRNLRSGPICCPNLNCDRIFGYVVRVGKAYLALPK